MNHFVYHNLFLSSSVFLHTFPLSLSLSSPPLSYSLALLVLEILYSLTNLCIIPLIINFSIPSPYPSSVFKLPLSNSMIRLLPFPFFIYNLSLTHLFFGNRPLIFSYFIHLLRLLPTYPIKILFYFIINFFFPLNFQLCYPFCK